MPKKSTSDVLKSEPNVVLSLSGAGVQKRGRWLVRGIDLTLAKGEIVTLIGPNGSGKSTTAKLALGLMQPNEGTVDRKRARISYMPQRLALDWTLPLTVARFMSVTGPISASDGDNALRQTGVHHLLKSDLQSLSGGELQRVQLARAIARKPDLMVLDEPTQGVDFTGESELYQLIAEARDKLGCAVLMISHDLHIVMAATDRVLRLNGHVCCSGSPQSVVADPAYRNLFGSRAASSIAVYQHQHDHTHLPDGRVLHEDGSITDHCAPDHDHNQGSHKAGDRGTHHAG